MKDWDLNIFFRDLGDEDDNVAETATINAVIYTTENGTTSNEYTDILIECSFAESRYLRSVYSEQEYGTDWVDSLENFLKVAPPRIAEELAKLPALN